MVTCLQRTFVPLWSQRGCLRRLLNKTSVLFKLIDKERRKWSMKPVDRVLAWTESKEQQESEECVILLIWVCSASCAACEYKNGIWWCGARCWSVDEGLGSVDVSPYLANVDIYVIFDCWPLMHKGTVLRGCQHGNKHSTVDYLHQ